MRQSTENFKFFYVNFCGLRILRSILVLLFVPARIQRTARFNSGYKYCVSLRVNFKFFLRELVELRILRSILDSQLFVHVFFALLGSTVDTNFASVYGELSRSLPTCIWSSLVRATH